MIHMPMPIYLLIATAAAFAAALNWRWGVEAWRHNRRIRRIPHRIHVNGIRGKSTVTRIVAGLLREAGYATIAKTTGTAAAVVTRAGFDVKIHRNGPPTILEQLDVIEHHAAAGLDALVIECMAVNPIYQKVSEERMIRSTIGILTNVREDHQDLMGETLPEIAVSLMSTCPRNGILITAESNPEIVPIIAEEARRRGTLVVWADADAVTEDDLARFGYVAFKENVAIGLALAELLWIDRETALEGMAAAPADPGVLRIRRVLLGGKHVTWANLFAVNDRESMVAAMERLEPWRTPNTTVVGILNNRPDRARRAIQFADVAVRDLSFDRLATFGAFEETVTTRLVANGYPRDRIVNLGERRDPSLDEIVEELVVRAPTDDVMLVGFVNIHTHQAEMLMELLEGVEAVRTADLDVPVTMPAAVARRAAAAALRSTRDERVAGEQAPAPAADDDAGQVA